MMPTPTPAPLLLQHLTTPLGQMAVCASEQGICLLEFTTSQRTRRELDDLQRLTGTRIVVGDNAHTRQAIAQLGEYFAGERRDFSLPLHTPGTAFQQRVWQALCRIPYGETVSYQWQAEQLGNAGAIRAVAAANGANRIAIVIPCHRVIGKDGSLTGYGGGLQRKAWLLAHEQRLTAPVQQGELF